MNQSEEWLRVGRHRAIVLVVCLGLFPLVGCSASPSGSGAGGSGADSGATGGAGSRGMSSHRHRDTDEERDTDDERDEDARDADAFAPLEDAPGQVDDVPLDVAGPLEDVAGPLEDVAGPLEDVAGDALTVDTGAPDDADAPPEIAQGDPALSVTMAGTGSGHVWSSPPGIDCPGACEASFPAGTTVTLHPVQDGDSALVGWDGACGGTAACVVTLDDDVDLEITFDIALVSVWTLSGEGPDDRVWFTRIAAYEAGGLAVAGGFRGTVDFGDGPLLSAGYPAQNADGFVARYGPDDELMWLWTFGDEEPEAGLNGDAGFALAPDSAGNVVVVGAFVQTVDFGDGPVTVPEPEHTVVPQGAFVVKLARLDGSILWSWTAPLGVVRSAVVTPSDDVIVAGQFSGTAEWGDEQHVASGKRDVFLAKHSKDGEVQWVRTFGDEAPVGIDFEGASVVRLAPNGDVVLAGFYDGTIDLGGETHTAILDDFGVGLSTDIFIARYTEGGEFLWSRSVGGPGAFNAPKSLSVTPDGRVLAVGWWSHLIDFGGQVFSNGENPTEIDLWIARWDVDGALDWAHTAGTAGTVNRWDEVIVDDTGRAFIVGGFHDQMVFGEPLDAVGGMDALITEIDEDGEPIWTHQPCKSAADDLSPSMAIDGQGLLVIGGWFEGVADFGEGPVASTGPTSGYVMRRLR